MNRLTLLSLIVIVALSCATSMPRFKRCALIPDDSNSMNQIFANSAIHILPSDGKGKSTPTSEMKKLDRNRVNPKASLKTKVERIDDLWELSKYKVAPNNELFKLVNKKFRHEEDKSDSKKPAQNGATVEEGKRRKNNKAALDFLIEGTEPQIFNDDKLDERDGANDYNSMLMEIPEFIRGTDDDNNPSLHKDHSVLFGDKNQDAVNKKLAENTEKIYQFSKSLIKNPSFVDNRPKPLTDKTNNKNLKIGEVPTSSAIQTTTGVGITKTAPSQNQKPIQDIKNAKVSEMPENPEDSVDEHEQEADNEDESESENENDEREHQLEHHEDEKELKQNEQKQQIRPLKTHQRPQESSSYLRQPSRPFAPRVENIDRRMFANVDLFPLNPKADYDDLDTVDYPYRSRNSISSNSAPLRSRHLIANALQSYLVNENDDSTENEIKIRCPPHRGVLSKKSNYDDDEYYNDGAINDRGMVCSCHFIKNKKKARCGHW